MTDPSEVQKVYRKVERKQKIITGLEELFQAQMDASEALDKKAWELLKVTSATFGLVSALEITLTEGNVGKCFWIGLGLVLLLHLFQVVVILWAVRPMNWHFVPGGADGEIRFDTLLVKYIYPDDENDYLDKLIVDYVGKKKQKTEGETPSTKPQQYWWNLLVGKASHKETDVELGAIQIAQKNNNEKAKCLRIAAVLFGSIVYGLVLMAVAAVK